MSKLIVTLLLFLAPAAEVTTTEETVEEAAPTPVTPAPIEPIFNPKDFPGVTGPFGFFDPLDLCPKDESNFKKYRESELKHGRIAMLAFVGILFGEKAGFLFGDKITFPAIYQFQQAQDIIPAFVQNVVGLTLAVEGFNIVKGWEPIPETLSKSVGIAGLVDSYENGDLGFDPAGLKPESEAAYKTMKTKELNNGRLAMLAVAGIVAQELVTNSNTF